MKVQQSSRIKAIERKYQQIILDKTDKHKKEIDELSLRFQDSTQIEKDFQRSTKLLQDAEIEIEHHKAEKEALTKELKSCKVELQEKIEELSHYKSKVQAKVDEVTDQQCNTINKLRSEIIDLKKMLMRKSEELTDMKIEEDKRLKKRLYNIKKTVISARTNHASTSRFPEINDRIKRSSTPSTNKDESDHNHQQHLDTLFLGARKKYHKTE
ncbi:uncharacterized protein PF3D7_1120000-like [Dysidea avara]|uniref:uncharacterized protein PF3D7_1120000-like n=1 Tax=Dysidea avara TaxID=196820 RepID=UPI003325F0C5